MPPELIFGMVFCVAVSCVHACLFHKGIKYFIHRTHDAAKLLFRKRTSKAPMVSVTSSLDWPVAVSRPAVIWARIDPDRAKRALAHRHCKTIENLRMNLTRIHPEQGHYITLSELKIKRSKTPTGQAKITRSLGLVFSHRTGLRKYTEPTWVPGGTRSHQDDLLSIPAP